MKKPLAEQVHHDVDRFKRDMDELFNTCSVRGAFCMGIATAAAIECGGYPIRKTLELAAQQDPSVYTSK